ncbi:hypothetical protein [Blastopirellula marina]|uniref:Glycosyltransferase RgtA/B/C/D-like domain-containing protein n=1 Tax=Blastopirellula marina TaxID=124 RepID=A0A2S8FHA7_9BACT|nr:hypothetical protein [Blastopirellula marina]PQO31555.1 hypothetical protein C5Y98_19225 [Blastopirellula marina]PTL42861.1 hypothetical protein C5Y97_19235 [Blastopirellula marina]
MDSPSDAPANSPRPTSMWYDRQWYAVLLIALVIRGGMGYAQLDGLQDDPDSYRKLARNILWVHSFTYNDPAEPTAFRPPLYPLLLAITSPSHEVRPGEVLALHTVLGLITVGLTFYWARSLGLGRWRSLAALLVTVDPILLNQSTLVMTETLATCLAILTLVAISAMAATAEEENSEKISSNLTIRAANVAGAVALAIYCRPTFLVWAALLPLAISLCVTTWRHRLIAVASYSLMLIFLLVPWVARNWLVFQAPVLGTTHGGHTLLWGNNDSFYEYLKSGTTPTWDNEAFHNGFNERHPYEHTSASELARDRSAYAEAIESMQANPAMAAYSCLVRLTMFWRPLPHALSAEESPKVTALRYAIGTWYVVQFTLAIAGLIALGPKLAKPGWLAAILLMASFTLVHLFFWSNMRMRSPLVPILAVLACAGIDWLFRALRKR